MLTAIFSEGDYEKIARAFVYITTYDQRSARGKQLKFFFSDVFFFFESQTRDVSFMAIDLEKYWKKIETRKMYSYNDLPIVGETMLLM